MIFQKLQNLSSKHPYLIVFLFNLLISFLFFTQNLNSGYTDLSSDSHNILPVCVKLDETNLYQNDLYLNEVENVEFYTPFYVQTLRFFKKISNTDYLLASNLLFSLTHLLYGFFWFVLFYKLFKDFWIALFISVLIRGLVWLPGYEIWGISDFWTLMPRTVYSAIMPIPFIFLLFQSKHRLFFSSFLIGFFLNFHPITGLGGILIFYLVILWVIIEKYEKINLTQFFSMIILTLIGMSPFFMTYLLNTDHQVYDKQLFEVAFYERINHFFKNPVLFLKLWLKISTLFFVVPIVFLIVLSFQNKLYVKETKLILASLFILILLPNLSVYLENFINNTFNKELKMSFQLIRIQKLAIIPSFFAMGYLLIYIFNKWKNSYLKASLFVLFLFILSVSNAEVFNKVPLMGDDIFRTLLPNGLNLFNSKRAYYDDDLEKMLSYIKSNTDERSIFYGPSVIRIASKRSVVMDSKGASMILESNPKKFINWYNDNFYLKNLTNEKEKIEFLKTKKVDYILTKDTLSGMKVSKNYNVWKLYNIKE